MDNDSRIFEIIMLICFGSSWPFAVAKTLRTKVVKGKSFVFLVLILIGYISGIINKFVTNLDHVIWLYCLNGSMVLTEIGLYLKYEKVDLVVQLMKTLKYSTKGEKTMDCRRIVPGIMVITLLLTNNSGAFSETETKNGNRQAYERCLNQIISVCNSKDSMANSRSATLRNYCKLAAMKAEFVMRYKEQLIEEVSRIKMPLKPYKIHLFVNSKFFEKMRNAAPLADTNL